MAAYDFQSLVAHVGHQIACVTYGGEGALADNVAVECSTCHEVLLDFNREDDEVEGEDAGVLAVFRQKGLL